MNAPIINEQALEESAAVSPKRAAGRPPVVAAAAAGQQPLQGLPRGLLGTESLNHHEHGWGHGQYSFDRRYRSRPQWQRYGRYDRAALSPWLAPVNSYSSIRPQPLPLLSGVLGGLLQLGNPRSTAQSLAQAYNGGQSEQAAQAVASAFAGDGSSSAQASTMAQAMAQASANHPTIAPGLLAQSANLATTRGRGQQFASTLADAFGYAKQQSQVPQFTSALCSAINSGGDPVRYASGEAIAKAIAGGGDSKAAVAEATATALCAGGSTAQAWSSAYAIALSKDKNGCLVLNEAKAMAQAKCGDGAADAISNAEASSNVLGFCGMLDGFFPDNADVSLSGGNSDGSAAGSGFGNSRPYISRDGNGFGNR